MVHIRENRLVLNVDGATGEGPVVTAATCLDRYCAAERERLAAWLREERADTIVWPDAHAPLSVLMALVQLAAAWRVAVSCPAGPLRVLGARGRIRPDETVAGPVYVFRPPRQASVAGVGCSRLIGAWLLALSAPVLLMAALAVWMQDGSAPFYTQTRFGRNGQPFRLWKVRTMRPRADREQQQLERQALPGRAFTLPGDPRITRLGRWLRHHAIDELPQLLNVARGEMRLVGPRPLPASEEKHYTQGWHRERLNGVPGLTGLWQVSGRHALGFDEMCVLDIWYLRNRSLRLDLRIVWRTLGVLLRGQGT